MSDYVRDVPATVPAGSTFQYPFAQAPDVIRAHQKDAYFQGVLLERLSSVLRTTYGARFAHTYSVEARTLTDFIYLALTTLVGNRTLGEEYCDIVQIEDDTLRLPSLVRRGSYILASVLLPYSLTRLLPAFRRRLRAKLEHNLRQASKHKSKKDAWSMRIQTYLAANLDTLTSPAPIYALSLATFYFTGAYYHLSKRLSGLRYIFTRNPDPAEARGGYEVLGVLLALQLGVQAWTHAHSTYLDHTTRSSAASDESEALVPVPPVLGPTTAVLDGGVEVSLDPNAYSSNNALLLEGRDVDSSATEARVRRITHTPRPEKTHSGRGGKQDGDDWDDGDADAEGVRYNLADDGIMGWIDGRQQRKCTLCLEAMKDPSVTTCGHVFCWACIRDWLAERAECPLCRQGCTTSHVLPLRC